LGFPSGPEDAHRPRPDPSFEADLRAFHQALAGSRPLPRPTLRSAWRNVLLFALTAGSIYLAGGPLLVLALMSILLAHEMGHYLMCRRYGVDATLPFFIPLPVVSIVGTLGAFIRIKAPFPHRRALLDIGLAGPLAGFVMCLPVLVLGVLEARVVPRAPSPYGLSLGEPLLFQVAAWLAKGPLPDDVDLSIGPLGMAAWFGLFVTALNLMPIGQLDGGHVAYALFRGGHRWVSRVAFALCLVLLYLRPTWLLWSILLLMVGRRHPPTLDDAQPLDRGRVALGVLGFVIFAVCFTPNPVLVSWADFADWR
jgi:membrane-associated protease RseP (regulator of RpoE activity)